MKLKPTYGAAAGQLAEIRRWKQTQAVSFKAPPTAAEVRIPQHASAKDVRLAYWHKMASQELKPAHSDADRILFIIQEQSRVARSLVLASSKNGGSLTAIRRRGN